jgi:hypothetical protein
MNHPLALSFTRPVLSTDDGFENYFQQITNPKTALSLRPAPQRQNHLLV